MSTARSKAQMAKTLIERGCPLAFNTLRKYNRDTLASMLYTALHEPTEHPISEREAKLISEMPPVAEDDEDDLPDTVVVPDENEAARAPDTMIAPPTYRELRAGYKPTVAPRMPAQGPSLADRGLAVFIVVGICAAIACGLIVELVSAAM